MSLGTNVSVTSCTWVTDWKIDTANPMTRLTARNGPANFAVRIIACTAISMMLVSVTKTPLLEALEQRANDEAPAVDQDEQEELERERHHDWRQHHHPHRHQRGAHRDVDDEERHEHDEADDERRLQLREDERGHELGEAHVLLRRRSALLRRRHEHRQLLRTRLRHHELAHRYDRGVPRLRLVLLTLEHRLQRRVVHLLEGGAHHEEAEEQRQSDQHLVRRDALQT